MVSPSFYCPYDSVVDPKKIDPLAYLRQNLISLSDPNVSLLNRKPKGRNQAADTSHRHTGHPMTLHGPWTLMFIQGTFLFCEECYILRIRLWGVIRTMTGMREAVVDLLFYSGLQEVVEGCKKR